MPSLCIQSHIHMYMLLNARQFVDCNKWHFISTVFTLRCIDDSSGKINIRGKKRTGEIELSKMFKIEFRVTFFWHGPLQPIDLFTFSSKDTKSAMFTLILLSKREIKRRKFANFNNSIVRMN